MPIPTYQLQSLMGEAHAEAEFYFPDYARERPVLDVHRPYCGDYYKLSLCLKGHAELKANQKAYGVGPSCLVLSTPDVIKEWVQMDAGYEALTIFFSAGFVAAAHGAAAGLPFLVAPSTYVLPLGEAAGAELATTFRHLEQKYRSAGGQREAVLRNLVSSLLYEVGALYDSLAFAPQPNKAPGLARAGQLASAFRALVRVHGVQERQVAFYADLLCITPKHLNAVVKAATGCTASQCIAASVVLEAKALLQNPALSIQEVANSLHFADQHAFSRYFKKGAGCSPTTFRQGC